MHCVNMHYPSCSERSAMVCSKVALLNLIQSPDQIQQANDALHRLQVVAACLGKWRGEVVWLIDLTTSQCEAEDLRDKNASLSENATSQVMTARHALDQWSSTFFVMVHP